MAKLERAKVGRRLILRLGDKAFFPINGKLEAGSLWRDNQADKYVKQFGRLNQQSMTPDLDWRIVEVILIGDAVHVKTVYPEGGRESVVRKDRFFAGPARSGFSPYMGTEPDRSEIKDVSLEGHDFVDKNGKGV